MPYKEHAEQRRCLQGMGNADGPVRRRHRPRSTTPSTSTVSCPRGQRRTTTRSGTRSDTMPPILTVKKFHDANANGVFDGLDSGWRAGRWTLPIPMASTNTVYTTALVIAEPSGEWKFLEATPANTLQTASYVDSLPTDPFPTNPAKVAVAGTDKETHEIVFGDVGLGSVSAKKIYDRNANGVADFGEPLVPGWKFDARRHGSERDGSRSVVGDRGCGRNRYVRRPAPRDLHRRRSHAARSMLEGGRSHVPDRDDHIDTHRRGDEGQRRRGYASTTTARAPLTSTRRGTGITRTGYSSSLLPTATT